jgi:programmed cell death protein 5
MNEEELEEIRKKKLRELQLQYLAQESLEEQRRQVELQRRLVLKQILTPKARERLTTLRLARPELATVIENQLLQLLQTGRLVKQVDDKTLKELLAKLGARKREIKIKRR